MEEMDVSIDKIEVGTAEVGIVVRDMDACAGFYGDTLGLRYLGEFDMPGGGLMRRFKQGDAVVKLVVWRNPPSGSSPPGGPLKATGIRWFSLSVDDLPAMARRCAEAGTRVVLPPYDGHPGTGKRFMIIEDPEGNWVELGAPAKSA